MGSSLIRHLYTVHSRVLSARDGVVTPGTCRIAHVAFSIFELQKHEQRRGSRCNLKFLQRQSSSIHQEFNTLPFAAQRRHLCSIGACHWVSQSRHSFMHGTVRGIAPKKRTARQKIIINFFRLSNLLYFLIPFRVKSRTPQPRSRFITHHPSSTLQSKQASKQTIIL